MLPTIINNTLSLTSEKISESTMANISQSIADSTKKAYLADLRLFKTWLDESVIKFQPPIDPVILANYISYLDDKDYAPNTIERKLNAISWYHRNNCYESHTSNPHVHMTKKGMMRKRANEGRKTTATSKKPLRKEELKAIIGCIDTETLLGKRDKAMLLVGWSPALRRSEAVALRVDDITITGPGADILIRKSKTDQTGQGETVSIFRGADTLCPVKALLDWYKSSGITSGPVFRRVTPYGKTIFDIAVSDRTYAETIKKYCSLAGLDPKLYSGHSSRSGMLTSAAEKGADLIPLAQHARHKCTNQTMHYIRLADRFKNNPTEGLL